tara:strand:- start:2454 stop:3398 length:945 start_codon:yes stop_codon:yes gene_type:complete
MYSLTKEKGIKKEKVLFVSSDDRDITKWPNLNNFEIQLPETYRNIVQIELISSQFYLYIHTFTQENQNTAFIFKVPRYTEDPIMCVISEGTYNMEDMAHAIEKGLNEATTKVLLDKGWYTEPINNYVSFEVKVGPSKKIEIHNRDDSFQLLFEEQVAYKVDCKNPTTKWFQPTDWGLGYYLGFEKKNYESVYDGYSTRQILRAPFILQLDNEKYVHMEIEKYNQMDELIPYCTSTNTLFNNDFGSTVNRSFALIKIYNDYLITSDNDWDSDPVLRLHTPESISKLKFTFRRHNGDLVNFENQPFSFQLKFTFFE